MRIRKSLSLFGGAALAIALASSMSPAYAQYGDRGRDNNNNNNYNQNNQVQRDRSQYQDNRSQFQSDRNDRGNYHRFDDHDRQAFRSWYNSRRRNPPMGFRRGDWLPGYLDARIRNGYRIGPEFAPYYRPIPYDLARHLPFPPRGYKYVMLGDRIVLVDNWNTVRDGFSFHLNL